MTSQEIKGKEKETKSVRKYIGFFNPAGPMPPFRAVDELERDVKAQGQVLSKVVEI